MSTQSLLKTSLTSTSYDHGDCRIGVVHVGYGAFHRAHQAVYIDDAMQASNDLNWGIAAVNLRALEHEAFALSGAAEGGYTLKTIAPDGSCQYRLVRSHLCFVDATKTPDEAADLVAMDSVNMVTITVTESGYYLNELDELDTTATPIAEAIAGKPSETIYAYLADALERRWAKSGKPISVLCCDNIRGNGHILQSAMLAYLNACGKADLAAWMMEKVTFPCSMVDRITPRSTPKLQDEITALFPNEDISPIHAETFLQWVIEDNFAGPMPDLAAAGVEIVSDVKSFEEAKIRILNGGHTGLAYLGALAGYQTFDQAMRDQDLRGHFDRFQSNEVLPGLGDEIPFNTADYCDQIAQRFRNRGIADNLERICMDGYSKIGLYIKPTIEACLQKGIEPDACFDIVASWVVYARKYAKGDCAIPYHEPYWDTLVPKIEPGREQDIATDPQVWGDLPTRFESFVPSLVDAIQRMDKKWQA